MKIVAGFSIVLPVFITVLLTACSEKAAPPAEAPSPEVTTVTMKVERVALTRELPGRTHPFMVAEVRPQVTGIVEERLFTEGGLVEAGAALYQIDDSTYRANFNSAKASLARAEASVELARVNAVRTRGLRESNAVSQQEYDNALAALQQAEADVGVAKAAVINAEVLLNYSRITSPISGRIGRSSVTQGALVTANQPEALATVQQLDPIHVDVSQASRELLALRRAMASGEVENAELPVTIVLEDGTHYEHTGTVAFSEVSVDPTTGSFVLRVVVPNPDHLLLPGMYVRAIIGRGIREEALLVPQQAVARDASGRTSVMLVSDNRTIEQRAIDVGRSVDNRWLVDAGLQVGDRVVIEGLQKIRPGMEVRVAEAIDTESGTPASHK